MRRIAVNGVHLGVGTAGSGPALLLLHGFTGSASTWTRHLDAWRGFTTIAVDLLGHGNSDCPADPRRYGFEHAVADLLGILDRLGVVQAAVLGYSMGGRLALHLALHCARDAPGRVSALVLESTSPGIDDTSERRAKARSDRCLAAAIEREGIDSFVERWEALPLFSTQERLPARARERLRRQRLANDPRGLANCLRGMSVGVQEPLLAHLGTIDARVLLIAGVLDEKYHKLAQQMAARLPRARVEIVSGAGHAVHLEQPLVFARTVQSFLDEHADEKKPLPPENAGSGT
jgi:2-succinyl-6-hydroxy-2,4-cyclohexadiene-1-carboxylate synthase